MRALTWVLIRVASSLTATSSSPGTIAKMVCLVGPKAIGFLVGEPYQEAKLGYICTPGMDVVNNQALAAVDLSRVIQPDCSLAT